jgi:hypothetical protein
MALDWDILNEDFSNISSWANNSTGGGAPSAVTFDGKSCLKLDFPSNATDTESYASVYRTDITIPNTFTLEISIYHDLDAGYGSYVSAIVTGGKRYVTRCGRRTSAYSSVAVFVDSAHVQGELTSASNTAYLDNWITYRFVVKTGNKIDIWGNNIPYIIGEEVTHTATPNQLSIYCVANTGNRSTLYVDYIKIDTTPEGLGVAPLCIGDQKIISKYTHSGVAASGGWLEIPSNNGKFKIYNKDIAGNACVCDVPLVATDNALASKVRIYDGSTTKSLMKIPT